MNKTQINYMNERLDVINRQLIDAYQEKYPKPIPMTTIDKLNKIISNKVELNYSFITELISSESCPYWLNQAVRLYDFSESDDLYSAKNSKYHEKLMSFKKKLDVKKQKYLDDFVLCGKEDTKIIEKFSKTKV